MFFEHTSNFLEHLRTKDECDRVFAEVRRILRPGGCFVIMGPNIRYLAAEYWDFYDHCLPLSHLSLEEGLVQADYEIERLVPCFLPYTTRSRLPQLPSIGPFRSRGAFSANNSSSLCANLSLSKCQGERTTTAAPAPGSRDHAAQISPDSRAVPGGYSAPRRARSRRLLRAS